MTVRIMIGDALSQLAALPDASVHCAVTSPPYWGLRAYKGDGGMIGLEPTFDEHLENLVAVFREVRRVLRSDGTLWLNYGDAYASNGVPGFATNGMGLDNLTRGGAAEVAQFAIAKKHPGLKPKDLMMMPARVAMALQADGWWLRSEIIWHKPNPMPESCTDRPTSAHEKMFLFSRAPKYFYDAEAVRTEWSAASLAVGDAGRITGKRGMTDALAKGPMAEAPSAKELASRGANLRNVWTIATHAFNAAHFATFPPALVEPCIKAGTSAKGCCGECGAPWRRDVASAIEHTQKTHNVHGREIEPLNHGSDRADRHVAGIKRIQTTGWSPSCEHDAPTVPATCLDPFAGSGTVGLVADRLQRDAILIEISADYAAMARARIEAEAGGLFGAPVETIEEARRD